MTKTYRIGFYPDYAGGASRWKFIGQGVRNRKRAFRIVYWLRRRGIAAFAEAALTMPIFLVVYRDEDGPYAQAFSTRAGAEAFIASFSRPADFTLVCTVIDQSLALVADEETP